MFKHLDIFYDETNRCYQVRTKASSYVIEFDNDGKYEIFESFIKLAKDDSYTLQQIADKLKDQYEDAEVMDVLSNLNEFGLLPVEETIELEGLDEKPKNFTPKLGNLKSQRLKELSVLILGDSQLSPLLETTLKEQSFKKVVHRRFEDIPDHNGSSMKVLIEPFDFIILDAVEWNPFYTEQLNKAALKQKKPWIFVGGLEEYKFKVGPIFFGRETGCYNCLIKRMKSNLDHLTYFNAYEKELRENRQSAKPDRFPYLEAYYGYIANMVLLEITKFFEMWAVPTLWKKFLSINALNYHTEEHHLLKVPFCEVCKPQLEYNPSPWLETITLQEKETTTV